MPEKKVLFRTDAGKIKGLSFGHAARCVVLAEELRKRNIEIRFLMRDYPEGVDYVAARGFPVETVAPAADSREEVQKTRAIAEDFSPDWLVVDLPDPDPDTAYFSALRQKGLRICFVDDARYIVPDADVILNSSILAPERYAAGRADVRMLLGPAYFIFNPGAGPAENPFCGDPVFRVVVSFGGSDPAGLTEKAVACLADTAWGEAAFHVILGPGYGRKEALAGIIGTERRDIVLVDNPDDLYPYLMHADLVVCAGGRTLYEAAALGASILAVASIDHEAPVIEAFVKNKMAAAGMTRWDRDLFARQLASMVAENGPTG